SSRTAHSLSSEHLVIRPISAGVFQHISYLNTDSFGKVECNGMIVTDNDEAVIFDTPSDIPASLELINWVEKELGMQSYCGDPNALSFRLSWWSGGIP